MADLRPKKRNFWGSIFDLGSKSCRDFRPYRPKKQHLLEKNIFFKNYISGRIFSIKNQFHSPNTRKVIVGGGFGSRNRNYFSFGSPCHFSCCEKEAMQSTAQFLPVLVTVGTRVEFYFLTHATRPPKKNLCTPQRTRSLWMIPNWIVKSNYEKKLKIA